MINNIYDTFQTSIFDVFISILILIVSFSFLIFLAYREKKNIVESLLVFFFHYLIGIVYIIISHLYEYTDSIGWYLNSGNFLKNNMILDHLFSNYLISNNYLYILNFIFILSKISFFNTNLIFNFFSSIGLVFFYYSLIKYRISEKLNTKNVILLFFFLSPSFMFWTSGISKDSLIFFFCSFMIYTLDRNGKKNYFIIILLIFFIYFIRPYIGIIFILSFIFYLILFYLPRKYFFSLLFILGIIFLYNYNNLIYIFNKIISYRYMLLDSYDNTYLGISKDMNFVFRSINFFISPFFFNTKNNFMLIIISFENLFLLIFLISLFINFRFNLFLKKKNNIDWFILIYILLATFFLSQTTSNLGIAFRQKWMIIPFLIYFLIKYQDKLVKKIF